jgi:hypothetical protein
MIRYYTAETTQQQTGIQEIIWFQGLETSFPPYFARLRADPTSNHDRQEQRLFGSCGTPTSGSLSIASFFAQLAEAWCAHSRPSDT